MSYSIVTHDGRPHFDEVASISLLLAKYEVEAIQRREPTERELADPKVWVLDTGGRYEPRLRNFDHHKDLFPSTDCCFSLLLSYLRMADDFKDAYGWYIPKVVRDCKGLRGVGNYLGVHPDKAGRLMSNPFESWILEEVRSSPTRIFPGSFLWEALERFGTGMLRHVAKLKDVLNEYEEFGEDVKGAGLDGFFVPFVETMDRGAFGMDVFRRRHKPKISFTITPDTRGPGYSLFRYDDDLLDFRKVGKDPRIRFVHNSGFCASTEELLPLEELVDLVDRSAVLVIR